MIYFYPDRQANMPVYFTLFLEVTFFGALIFQNHAQCYNFFRTKIGHPLLWTSGKRQSGKGYGDRRIVKRAVVIEAVYPRYILVKKQGKLGIVRYCVNYGSLISGEDEIQLLDFSVKEESNDISNEKTAI